MCYKLLRLKKNEVEVNNSNEMTSIWCFLRCTIYAFNYFVKRFSYWMLVGYLKFYDIKQPDVHNDTEH